MIDLIGCSQSTVEHVLFHQGIPTTLPYLRQPVRYLDCCLDNGGFNRQSRPRVFVAYISAPVDKGSATFEILKDGEGFRLVALS